MPIITVFVLLPSTVKITFTSPRPARLDGMRYWLSSRPIRVPCAAGKLYFGIGSASGRRNVRQRRTICKSWCRTQTGRVTNLKRNAPERIPNGLVTYVEQIIHEFQRRLTAIQ